MRELSTCDFCGGEAAGVYEVVPGDLPAVSSRRMVLCDGCRDTLASVVDPLLDAIPGGSGGPAGAGQTAGAAASGVESTAPEPSPEPTAEPSPEPSPEPEPEPSPEPDLTEETKAATEGTTTEPAEKPERIERPEGYGKVVRLVENRESGIMRRDLEELATSAYGLGASDVEAAIDFAIQEGRFVETENGLQTM